MRTLITGGGGFIGSHVTDVCLAAGDDVVILDNLSRGRNLWEGNARVRLVKANVEDQAAVNEAFAGASPEAVFHLAAHHYIPFCEQNPHTAFETNVLGTLNIVEACRLTPSVKKLFFASTGDVYAPTTYAHMEVDPPAPIYVYGETKLAGETLLRRYKSSVRVPFDITVGRLFNAAGPRETNPHFLPAVVRQIENGASLLEVGNLWPVRDFVDVRSMAKAIRAVALKSSGYDVFNIGSGEAITVETALGLIVAASGRKVDVKSVAAKQRPNDRPYLCPSVAKLKGAIGEAAAPFSAATARAIWDEPAATRILHFA